MRGDKATNTTSEAGKEEDMASIFLGGHQVCHQKDGF